MFSFPIISRSDDTGTYNGRLDKIRMVSSRDITPGPRALKVIMSRTSDNEVTEGWRRLELSKLTTDKQSSKQARI
jgi:hypothetical protein